MVAPAPEDDLPESLVEDLNLGLASGSWEDVLDHFAAHATLVVDRGSRTSFEGHDGIREALEGLRADHPGARYAPGPDPQRSPSDETLVSDLLVASGPDAPSGRLRLDLTSEGEVWEAVLEVEPEDAIDDAGP